MNTCSTGENLVVVSAAVSRVRAGLVETGWLTVFTDAVRLAAVCMIQ